MAKLIEEGLYWKIHRAGNEIAKENIFMKIENTPKTEEPMPAVNTNGSPDLGALFDGT